MADQHHALPHVDELADFSGDEVSVIVHVRCGKRSPSDSLKGEGVDFDVVGAEVREEAVVDEARRVGAGDDDQGREGHNVQTTISQAKVKMSVVSEMRRSQA